MSRPNDRLNDQMRPVKIIPNFIKHPDGSVLIEVGDTRVILFSILLKKRFLLF